VTEKWMKSGNMWLQRSALLFQLKYKKNTDEGLLYNYIERLADHKDFFIRKAIGWTLREYSKTNPKSVEKFIKSHTLSPLSVKEGMKRILK
ncbi:DNA alkylation repair protein, partial [Bacteroidetes/Chlorobi group bacterium ChocPot_Mid]